MHVPRSAVLAVCCGLLPATAGYAQTQGAPAPRVSLEQLVERALERNPELLAVRQRLAEAQSGLRQAGLRPNPAIGFSAASGDVLASRGERQFEISYAHILETAGKRGRQIEAAGLLAEISRLEIADQERRLRAGVALLYFEALAAMRNLSNAREILELTRRSYGLAEARARAGEGARLEQGLLRAEVQRLESEEVLFASQIERTILSLSTLTGEDLSGGLEEFDLLSRLPLAADPDRLLAQALNRRPDLQSLRLREQLAGAELNLARAEAVPDVVLTGRYAHVQTRIDGYAFAQIGGPLTPIRDKDNVLSAGVSIPLPIRNRNQGNIGVAAARQRAASFHRQALERSVRQEVLSAISRYRAARQAMKVFDEGVVPQSEENLRIVRSAYELGELRMLDVINEQRKLLDVHRALNGLFRDANVAVVELEQALGGPVQ